jgi:hypothetical protein
VTSQFPIEWDGRSRKPDLVVTHLGHPIAFILAKWSIRNDRLDGFELDASAIQQAYPDVPAMICTFEFDVARLREALLMREKDRKWPLTTVYHLSTHLLTQAWGDFRPLASYREQTAQRRLRSLSDLFTDITALQVKSAQTTNGVAHHSGVHPS